MNSKNKISFLLGMALLILPFEISSCGKGACTPRIPGDRRITMSYLGKFGRFGNHIYEYIFLKTYAKRHDLTVETPAWIGNQLFELDDPRISVDFCEAKESDELLRSYNRESSAVFVNRDLKGDFQIHTSHHAKDRDSIQALLQPSAAVKKQLEPEINRIRAGANPFIAIHLRRGDFGSPPYVVSPSEWYVSWLKENWPNWSNPVLYIASDEIDKVLPDFSEFHPLTVRDLKIQFLIPKADFYPDYYVLTQADVLAISNSTFSTSAALLNRNGISFYRPDFQKKKLVTFDPWNTSPWENWHN